MPPLPSLSPGYQFLDGGEYLISAFVERDEFDHGCVQLVLVGLRWGGGAAFQIEKT